MIARCRSLSLRSTFSRLSRKTRKMSSVHPELIDSTISKYPSDVITLSFFFWSARQLNFLHDCHSMARMLPVVSRLAERFGSVDSIVGELETIGCSVDPRCFMILLQVSWRGGLFRLALQVFDEMCRRKIVPNTFAWNAVLDILFKIGQFERAVGIFRRMEFPNFLSYNIVLRNLCERNCRPDVCDVVREMVRKRFHLGVGSFSVLVSFFGRVGRRNEMEQVLCFMIVSGERLTNVIWSILICSLCRAGDVFAASRMFQQMKESGCLPNVVTYTALVKGLLEAHMFSEAFDLLDAMSLDNCEPDLVFYNVVIHYLSKSGRYDDAIRVFRCVLEKGLKPDSHTLTSLIQLLSSSGKLQLLSKLVKLSDFSVDLVVCNSLMNSFCKAGYPSHAIEIFADMINKGFDVDNYSYVACLNALCKLGRIDYAVNLYNEMIVNNGNIDAYFHSTILNGLVKRREYHVAVSLFRKAVREDYCLDIVSYTIVISGLFESRRFEEARDLFKQLKLFGLIPNIWTYNVMLLGLCKSRDISAVKQLLEEMEVAGVVMNCISYNIIIGFLIKLGHRNKALLLFRKMFELGLKPNRATYSQLLLGLKNMPPR